MKLLQVNIVYKFASTGRTSYELEKYLSKNGWECHMAYSDGPDKQHNMCRMASLNRRRIHNVLARIFGKQGYYSPFATRKLIKYIRKIKPDVIHLRNLHSSYVSIVPLLKEIIRLDIPTVITLHDFWFFTGGCCSNYDCPQLLNECRNCKGNICKIGRPEHKVYTDKMRLLNQITHLAVIGVSKWTTAQIKQREDCKHFFTDTIYNWIDFDTFYYRDVKKEDIDSRLKDKFCVISVATAWGKDKGLPEFIKLSKMIPKDSMIVLVGSMPKDISLPNNILSIGQIKDVNRLAELYSIADVYVSLSNRETFGKTIAEAVSCTCPAIVQNVDACPEVIGEGCGYVVKPGDIKGIISAIEQVRQNGRAYYTECCIAHTRENFDYHTNAEKYNQLYQRLINDKAIRQKEK